MCDGSAVSRRIRAKACALVVCALVMGMGSQRSAASEAARWIASQVKYPTGIALDVGCGEAGLAIELAGLTGLTYHCIESSAEAVGAARAKVDSAGLYGTRITVRRGQFNKLDFPPYCASLIVFGDGMVSAMRGRDAAEVFRLLNPNGVAIIGQSSAHAAQAKSPLTAEALEKWLAEASITSYRIVDKNGVWAVISRPAVKGWDQWTHRGHDPANTYASSDTIGGPDLSVLWAAAPQPGLATAAMLTDGGKIIEIGRGYAKFADTTPYIQVSDAFTGLPIWARLGQKELAIDRPLLNYSPIRSCSDVAVAGGVIYVLGGKTCHLIDADTGKDLAAWPIPPEAKAGADDIWLYMALAGGRMIATTGISPKHQIRGFTGWGGKHWRGVSTSIFALDRKSGQLAWVQPARAETSSIVIGGGRMYFVDGDMAIHALDIDSGNELWTTPTELARGSKITNCALYRGKLWVMSSPSGKADSKTRDLGWKLSVYSARDGRKLFEPELDQAVASMTFSGDDVFLAPQHHKGQIYALSADTGRLKRKMLSSNSGSKCTPLLASANWLFYRHQAGSGFTRIDRRTDKRYVYDRIRVSCHYPGLPANGLLYVQGPGCSCSHPLRASVALMPRKRVATAQGQADRLVKGPAYDRPPVADAREVWASWRCDPKRGAAIASPASAPMDKAWSRRLAGDLTPLAAAGDRVYCGSTSRKLYALDARGGKVIWQYTAEGRIKVAPYWWQGRIYFGDDDGWAYCLAGDDGQVVWKFRAALGPDRIVGYGDVMSAWPVANGVLVSGDVAYLTAGFFPGDGGTLYALDAATGRVLWTKSKMLRRRSVECVSGPMAMGDSVLFLPTVGGPPMGVHLDDPNRKAFFKLTWVGAFAARGTWIMTLGDEAIVGSPDLRYIHHATTCYDLRIGLPVVDDRAIYMRDGRELTADKREAYRIQRRTGRFTYAAKPPSGRQKRMVNYTSPDKADMLWRAWKDVSMIAAIKAGDLIFSAGGDKVYATDSVDGREIWSASAGGKVTDLAFSDGRLLAVTDAGAVVAFVAPPKAATPDK